MGTAQVNHGYTEGDQLDAFQNATFATVANSNVVMSIATTIDVPIEVCRNQTELADYIASYLKQVIYTYPELSFEVQVGYSDEMG